MRITAKQIKKIIKEEIVKVMRETQGGSNVNFWNIDEAESGEQNILPLQYGENLITNYSLKLSETLASDFEMDQEISRLTKTFYQFSIIGSVVVFLTTLSVLFCCENLSINLYAHSGIVNRSLDFIDALVRESEADIREKIKAVEYYKDLYAHMDDLGMDRKFTSRSLNDGFSGGEKKRCEILQMSMLNPKYAILDETDSGLDIDALRVVSDGVNRMRNPERGILVITHYQRLLDYIVPDYVHVMSEGKIVRTGGKELALELEDRGYDWIKQEAVAS